MSEPPHQVSHDWLKAGLLDSYIDPRLLLAEMDLGSLGEQGYDQDDLDQYSAALMWPSDYYMLQPEAIHHQITTNKTYQNFSGESHTQEPSDHYMLQPEAIHHQTITNNTYQNFTGESHTQKPFSHGTKIVDVFNAHAVSKDPKDAEESENICIVCGISFPLDLMLLWHSKDSGHLSYKCETAGCNRTFADRYERDAHQRRPHTLGHGRITAATPYDCVQCHESLQSKANLLRHGKDSQHQPYACECGIYFSRLDVLNRHLASFSTDDPPYPCQYCKRHRGADGFRRKDHLVQHIRNYHHHEVDETAPDAPTTSSSRLRYVFPVCSHRDCPQYRDEAFKQLPRNDQDKNKPFSSMSAYTKHMREEHSECTFPCDVLGCGRVGRRGYFREKDLLKHRKKEHPDAPLYHVTKREARHRCTDCGKDLDPSSLSWHIHFCYSRKESGAENLSLSVGDIAADGATEAV